MKKQLPDISIYLRSNRERVGLSQNEVAAKLGLSHSQYLSNIERAVCRPSLKVLRKLIAIYGLDIHQVLDILMVPIEHELRRHFKISR